MIKFCAGIVVCETEVGGDWRGERGDGGGVGGAGRSSVTVAH